MANPERLYNPNLALTLANTEYGINNELYSAVLKQQRIALNSVSLEALAVSENSSVDINEED